MFGDAHDFGVKICGLTTGDQARAVAELGADAIGLNFWLKSKRYIAPALAAPWAHDLHSKATFVAVLVNASDELLDEVIDLAVVQMLQLHGDESPAECERVMQRGMPVIKALQVRDRESLGIIGDYPCERILLDAYCPGLYGGEGKTFPWELAIEAMQRFPDKHFILAGGLTPENIAEAVRTVRPIGVDVASGVESAPGIKDLALVEQFIQQAKSGLC